MEKYAMVKTEVQPNGDIFLYYVDENGTPLESTEGVITTIDEDQLQQLQENYVLEEMPSGQQVVQNIETLQIPNESHGNENVNIQNIQQIVPAHTAHTEDTNLNRDRWLDEETEKLLMFYTDNKEAFQNPTMKKKHLWTVACKTMLVGKNPASCEMKLRNLKRKYASVYIDHIKNNTDPRAWPFYVHCIEAFDDDPFVKVILQENGMTFETKINAQIQEAETSNNVVLKKSNKSPDEQVKQMLQLYLQYKKEGANDYFWQKKAWEKIALEIGEDADFWHKRFLNYKQHYLRMLEKRKECGDSSIVWPYMGLFDEIYANDKDFKQKYCHVGPVQKPVDTPPPMITPIDWNETEKTVLVKYYFDSLDEFHDPTIPDRFLWNEVGRLLDKKHDECKTKYEQLRVDHLMRYIAGGYDLKTRKPLAILFDNIISQEVEKECYETSKSSAVELQWQTENIDEMVQFLFDNIEIFKDPMCHYVCWAAIAMKLKLTVQACREQWNDLTMLYKSILDDKKEDPELQIDWRYIDVFDRIFDYGMDTKLLVGYEMKPRNASKSKKIFVGGNVKPVIQESNIDEADMDNLSDLEPEEFDEKASGKRLRGIGDPKQIKILEYYLRFKDKFSTSQRKKQTIWEGLAKDIGITAEQCAHRFRNLKQVYMGYVQREIEKPDKPILWPYYALCKRAFGYRMIKNKLKHTKMDVADKEEWTPREIKMLIKYFGQNYNEIDSNPDDISNWASIARELNKSKSACRDKFLDLRKSYRKIKLMMSRTPNCKVNWKYFKFFEEIDGKDSMDISNLNLPPNAIKTEIQDDDFQCIIVIPEGQEGNNTDSHLVIKDNTTKSEAKTVNSDVRILWTKEQKITLLKNYIQYLDEHNGQQINTREMWKEIGAKMGRKDLSCKKMFFNLKAKVKNVNPKNTVAKKSTIYLYMTRILSMKPNLYRPNLSYDEFELRERPTYDDVSMPVWIVEKALKYYLEHVEEFVNPKYDKKFAWIDLAKSLSVPVSTARIFKKVNYLKQFFDIETNTVKGEKVEFADLLKEILEKEFICKIAIANIPEPMEIEDTETTVWSDDETEQLLLWYLENLEKFKNPKYVPSYLWMEAAKVLNKSAVACSKQMTHVRSQYSAMAKENSDALQSWRFYALCQKIYGTGKKTLEHDQEES